jgi:hypothetical protein
MVLQRPCTTHGHDGAALSDKSTGQPDASRMIRAPGADGDRGGNRLHRFRRRELRFILITSTGGKPCRSAGSLGNFRSYHIPLSSCLITIGVAETGSGHMPFEIERENYYAVSRTGHE